jgi:hypothetical protein
MKNYAKSPIYQLLKISSLELPIVGFGSSLTGLLDQNIIAMVSASFLFCRPLVVVVVVVEGGGIQFRVSNKEL